MIRRVVRVQLVGAIVLSNLVGLIVRVQLIGVMVLLAHDGAPSGWLETPRYKCTGRRKAFFTEAGNTGGTAAITALGIASAPGADLALYTGISFRADSFLLRGAPRLLSPKHLALERWQRGESAKLAGLDCTHSVALVSHRP